MAERIVIDPGELWRPAGTWAAELRLERRSQLDVRRLAALAIDGLATLPAAVSCALVVGAAAGWLVAGAVALSYLFVAEAFVGQTLGKAAMGLRVVRFDGRPLTVASCAARNVLLPVDILFAGLAAMLATGPFRRQRLGDLLAGTVVTRAADHPHRPAGERLRPALVAAYAVGWIAAGCVAATLIVRAEAEERYQARVAALCERADRALAGADQGADGLDRAAVASYNVEHGLAAVAPPGSLRGAHTRLLAYQHARGVAFKRAARELRRSTDPRATARRLTLRLERQSAPEAAALRSAGVRPCA